MQEQLLTTRDVFDAFGRKPYDDEKTQYLNKGGACANPPHPKCANPPQADQPPLTWHNR